MQFSADQARHSLLRRQGLTAPFDDPLDVVAAMVAVQTQYAGSLAVAVAARLRKGKLGWEEPALAPGGSLVKAWTLRNTLHTQRPEDHALILGTIGPRLYRRYRNWAEGAGLDVDATEEAILRALMAGPLKRSDLHREVPQFIGMPMVGWGLDVMGLAVRGRVCVVGRGSEQRFCRREGFEPKADWHELFRRYLRAFGPATEADFRFWLGMRALDVALEPKHVEGIVAVEVEGMRGERWMIAEPATEELRPSLGVHLLAKFDPLVLAHREKSLLIPEAFRTRVFRAAGQVEATMLSEGQVCATWRMQRAGRAIRMEFEPLRKFGKREVQRAHRVAEALTKKLGGTLDRVEGLV
jgi:hypothetical protein